MKTTLELPPDVARILRMESAHRGGRKTASLYMLVANAVRKVYGATYASSARIQMTPGRVIVHPASDAPQLTADRIHSSLSDEP